MASDLTAEEMRLLGMYFESKPTRTHAVADPELAQVGRFVYNRGKPATGVAACADCHGAAGTAPTACRAWAASTRSTWRTSSRPSASASAPTTTR